MGRLNPQSHQRDLISGLPKIDIHALQERQQDSCRSRAKSLGLLPLRLPRLLLGLGGGLLLNKRLPRGDSPSQGTYLDLRGCLLDGGRSSHSPISPPNNPGPCLPALCGGGGTRLLGALLPRHRLVGITRGTIAPSSRSTGMGTVGGVALTYQAPPRVCHRREPPK